MILEYLAKKTQQSDLDSMVQIGKVEAPFYFYAEYYLNRKNYDDGTNPAEGFRRYAQWWYWAKSFKNSSAWENEIVGGKLKPALLKLLFEPQDVHEPRYFENTIPFCHQHFLFWHFLSPESRVTVVPHLDTPENRKQFLRWYYGYSIAWGQNPYHEQEMQWLKTTVNAKFADASQPEMPTGLFLYCSADGTLREADQKLFETIDSPEGFAGLWFFEYEEFLRFSHKQKLFQSWLETKYPDTETKQKRIAEIKALAEKNGRLREWSLYWLAFLENSQPLPDVAHTDHKTFLLPDSSHEVKSGGGVTVLGFPRSEFGIGEVTRSSVLALDAVKVPVEIIDLGRKNQGHPDRDSTVDRFIRTEANYAATILHAPIQYPSVLCDENYSLSFFKKRFFIGYCPWELEDWKSEYHFYYRFYDELWAPTHFVQQAFAKNNKVPVIYMPYPVYLPPFQKKTRKELDIAENRFLFLAMFDFNSKIERKNPLAAIRAFKAAFPHEQNVGLVVKAMYADANDLKWKEFLAEIADDSRIEVLNQVLSREDTFALLNSVDAFVSLHRSEGFGLGLAEAMLLSKPVIATQYSGNVDFCGEAWSFPVDFRMIPVQAAEYPFSEGMQWADPQIDSAANQMRKVYQGGEEVAKILAAAKTNIETHFSLESCGKLYRDRLEFLGVLSPLKELKK